MTEIYDAGNHILIKTGSGDPEMHSHSAAHIILSANGKISIITPEKTFECAGAFIPSKISHTVKNSGYPLLVFMFDETTTVTGQINKLKPIDGNIAEKICEYFYEFENSKYKSFAYNSFIEKSMPLLGFENIRCKISDERIKAALKLIDENICEELSCKETAEKCFLSESRFSHLFREQTGITFAGFVIQRRLIYAYRQIALGMSITNAAIEAGFSDSAHFAAVNKKMFGITASAVRNGLKLHRTEF